MPIAKITGPGLAAIACSVALLWGIFIGERILVKRAAAERLMVMRDIQQSRIHRSEPVSAPGHAPRPIRAKAG